MCAIMDSEWITGQRTAAASGLVIRHLAKDSDRTLGILGCGLQGRKHLEGVHAARPQLDRCVCYDLFPDRQERFIEEMTGMFGFDAIVATSGPEEVARSCDVLVTGGPIHKDRNPVVRPDWIGAGTLVVTIDFDSYVTDAMIRAMDLALTDDYGQIEDARRNEEKFPGVTGRRLHQQWTPPPPIVDATPVPNSNRARSLNPAHSRTRYSPDAYSAAATSGNTAAALHCRDCSRLSAHARASPVPRFTALRQRRRVGLSPPHGFLVPRGAHPSSSRISNRDRRSRARSHSSCPAPGDRIRRRDRAHARAGPVARRRGGRRAASLVGTGEDR